jgi:5-methylthioribose kinase
MTHKHKLSQLSEGIEYDNNEDYKSKIDLLKEHYFNTKTAATVAEDLNSDPVEVDEEVPQVGDPSMAAYANAISRSVRR